MLFVLFKARGVKYALLAKSVTEVTPLVHLTPLPEAPPYVSGLMNYRGRTLPVADLTVLLAGRPSRAWASTRIMVAEVEAKPGSSERLGLMAERVLNTKTLEASPAPPGSPAAPYLAGVLTLGPEVVQIIDPAKLLPAELLASLLAQAEADVVA
jgi:chemotaxis signal transduction protein